LSLVGAFFIMLVLGYSINLLTLLALVLRDRPRRRRRDHHRGETSIATMKLGQTPLQASFAAARELATPIIASRSC